MPYLMQGTFEGLEKVSTTGRCRKKRLLQFEKILISMIDECKRIAHFHGPVFL